MNGEIDTTVRIWKQPRVKVGQRYTLEGGYVVVDRMSEISIEDITPAIARACGFSGVVDLLKTAQHGSGQRVFLIIFHYEAS